jgi:anti-sigma regulatory factor (Ser/Thr protein kinase)
MSSQLICRPEQDLPVAILRVSGTLDTLTGAALNQAAARCVSSEPEALVIDVTRVRATEPTAFDPLGTLLRSTTEWPAVPVTLCGASPATARTIAAWTGAAAVTTAATVEQALAAATRHEPEPHRVRARLRPVPDACREVRQLVTQACAAWQRSELAATLALVATELVANVVRHAHTTMDLTLGLRDGRICLAVKDGSRRLPRPKDPTAAEAGGRGLHLVRELTDGWGVHTFSGGKVVWTHVT